MKLSKKNNIKFLENGGCFLYYFSDNPKCLLTMALLDSNVLDVFDDIQEKSDMAQYDCLGNIRKCPYIMNLWNLDEEEILEEQDETLIYGDIVIDFDYSWPYENPIITDVLFIPTNMSLDFRNFLSFDNEIDISIIKECRKRQLDFETGECVLTNGGLTDYPIIIHCIIMDDNQLFPENVNIGMSIYNALSKADDEGCQSISISPMIKIDKDIILPNINLFLKICLTTIRTYVNENETEHLKYILIHIPPNFNSNLQDVISEVDNVN